MQDRIITSGYRAEDMEFEPKLRPDTLDSYIGQESVKNNMKIIKNSAKSAECL